MKKNDKITVTIEDIGVNGEGIGKVEGYTFFVKDAIAFNFKFETTGFKIAFSGIPSCNNTL